MYLRVSVTLAKNVQPAEIVSQEFVDSDGQAAIDLVNQAGTDRHTFKTGIALAWDQNLRCHVLASFADVQAANPEAALAQLHRSADFMEKSANGTMDQLIDEMGFDNVVRQVKRSAAANVANQQPELFNEMMAAVQHAANNGSI